MTSRRILIVDDDRDFAESMAEIVELNGHRPILAHSGEQALQLLDREDIDIVFMDIRMPGINGIETFMRAHKLRPDLRAVMMTGYTDADLIKSALDNGAMGVLRKPVDVDELISVIEENGLNEVILLVDDDKDFAESLKSTLVESGYRVHVANDGRNAMNYVLNNKVNLMLLDLRLPGGNGLEVYNGLNEQGVSPPTFIVTAYAEEENSQLEEFKSLSVNHIFHKPFNTEELLEAIDTINR